MVFSAGSVLARGFTIFFKNFIPFSVLALIVHSPVILYAAVVGSDPSLPAIKTYAAVAGIGGLLLTAITVGAVTYGVFQQLRGSRPSIGQCIAAGLGRVVSVIGVSILTALALLGAALIPAVIAGMLAMLSPILAVIIVALPALLVLTVLWVAVPATVVERIGAMAALNRSSALTRGRRWSVFLVLFVLAVITQGTTLLVTLVGQSGEVSVMTLLVGSQIIGAIEGGLMAVTTAVGYHDLRVSHEGIATEDLAKVFD